MPNMAVGSNYRHRTYCYLGDQVAISTRYFKVGAITGGPVSENAFITSLDTSLSALYIPLLTNGALYIGSNIQSLLGGPPYEQPTGTNANQANGTGGTRPMPGQVCGIYSTTSELTGPGFRGRSYVPFPDTTAGSTAAPSIPIPTYQALLSALAINVIGSLNVTGGGGTTTIQWELCEFSPGGAVFATVPLTDFIVRPRWATQKRRGDYGRTNPQPTP